MNLADIKATLDSDSGKALKEYLLMKLEELRSIDNINEKDVGTHQAVEVRGQKRAYAKLQEILSDIMTFDGQNKHKDKRDSYAVEG